MLWLIDNLVQLVTLFVDVALRDPISFVLVATSTVIMAGAMLFSAYLFLGALVDAVTPDRSGRAPPRRA